jgi:uncharacterized protein YyaL (SSP411 family)
MNGSHGAGRSDTLTKWLRWHRAILGLASASALGCASHLPQAENAAGTPPAVDIAKARQKAIEPGFSWDPYEAASFAKAKAQGRYILVDGAAEWCHWCHVMDETTYRDPEIGRLIREKFVAVRVDIDARPDFAERYAEWGWPATILMAPDAEEIGKFRGYIPPERLLSALEGVLRDGPPAPSAGAMDLAVHPATVDSLPWVASRSALDLDDWWDPLEGGWGSRQKAPIGADIEFELLRAAHGDDIARTRALFTIEKERSLLDSVWGGLYQYSAASDWKSPHFEKLMTVQAAAIEARASAFLVTKDAAALADARAIARYLSDFLSAPDGGFYTNQDADVGAHDRGGPFVDGHTFYARDDGGRRALGLPWVDSHVYGRENGLAIAALASLYAATGDASTLARAVKAADRILGTHVLADGTVLHDADRRDGPFFLADAAALGRGLARLAQVTGDARYGAVAAKVVLAMTKNFADATSGALLEATADPNAAMSSAREGAPFADDVMAARALALVCKLEKDSALRDRARSILAAIANPRAVAAQGRWVGEFLLALDEAGAMTWPR